MAFTGGTHERTKGEQGFVLAVTGLMIVPLIIFTAFAVDLGAWYGQAAKMQRAADAAALAGVVQLPDQAKAVTAAQDTLARNGFAYTCVTAPATGPCVVNYPNGAGQQMSVTLKKSASQYFSKIVLSSETLTRGAVAVYNLKIPLGSPSNVFGNDPTRSGAQPNLWGAINGPYSNHADGDPYSPKCLVGPSSATSCSGSANPTYRTSGYIWAVDVPASAVGSPITVSIYDPSFGPNSTLNEGTSGTSTGFATSYQVFNTTGSSATTNLNNTNGMNSLGLCSAGPGYKVFMAGDTTGQNAWWTLCTFTPSVAGIYPVQVKTSAIPSVVPDSGGGWNAYSIKATKASGTQPQTYAVDDLSIWTPTPSSNARFYLANIGAQYAGHTLQVDLYDPGDGNSGNYFMTFHPPPAGVPAIVPTAAATTACTYSGPTATLGGATTNSSSTCTIQTRNSSASPANIYNNSWLRVQILIPSTYSCTTDCWWSIEYNFGSGTPTDRTVWVVNVLGDPVHLVQ